MLEQEIASAISFIIMHAGKISPYYDEVPEDFLVPSVYFPQPEITTKGDTLATYAVEYTWFINFFHVSKPKAYSLGLQVLTALKGGKNLIPLIDNKGDYIGRGFRIDELSLKMIDGTPGVAQLTLSWSSPRPYNEESSQKMMAYDINIYSRTAFKEATRQVGGK